MEPQSTTTTTTHSFSYKDFGQIELGWGALSTEDPGHQGGVFQLRFLPGIPSPAKGDRINDTFSTNAAGKIFQKASDLADRLLNILRQEYRFQACLEAGFGRGECEESAGR